MPAASKTAQTIEPSQHYVQFYGADQAAWAKSAGRYLAEGLASGESVLVVATPEHKEALVRELGFQNCDPAGAEANGRLEFCDATETLARLMVAGAPDWDRFESSIGLAVQKLVASSANGGLRAYGEMVGVLWNAGAHAAAIRLEEYWNRLLARTSFKLFCGYPINVFADDFHLAQVEAVVSAHTHVLPTGLDGHLDWAVKRAIDEVAGVGAARLEGLTQPSRHPRTQVPAAEAAILGLRGAFPGEARDIINTARRYYQTEKRFRALIENSSDAILLLDPDGQLTFAGASTTRVLGLSPQELAGNNFLRIIHPDDVETVRQALASARSRPGDPLPVCARMAGRMLENGARLRWVECTFTNLLANPDVGAIVANCRDISEQKAAQEKQQLHAEELARYNAELESFAYAATHDLREPLRTVAAFTQLLVDNSSPDPKQQQYSKFILGSVAHMLDMLDDLLALTSLRAEDARQEVDLRSALDQAMNFLEQTIHESGAVITVESLPRVLGNESQLTCLMQNLLANAIKYRSQLPVRIHVTAQPFGSRWLVRVSDNGIGIAPGYHEQIFGLFKRLERSIPGTGIGLAICKKIVDGMGGRIWVESQPGQGSTFCFTAQAAQ